MPNGAAPIEEVIDALNAAGVEYYLIGGAAMMLHGSTYVTRDIDICYERSRENIASLVRALKPFNPTLRVEGDAALPFLWDERTVSNGSNFTLSTSIGEIDILGAVTGIGTYAEMKPLAARYKIGAREVPMLTIEGLIIAKRAAGRAKDHLVLPELEMLRGLERLEGEPPES